MAAFFTLTLDTTAPSNVSISIPSPSATRSVTATLSATDATQMKIYGDIVSGGSAVTESTANWEAYTTSKAIELATGDGVKVVKVKFRDDVGNESVEATASVTLDMTAPVVTISPTPDRTTISEVEGFNECSFSFYADEDFTEFKVCVVTASSSSHDVGTTIGMSNGSQNMSGAAGNYKKEQSISCVINATDLKAASSGDGAKYIKIFVKDSLGNWSV